MWCSRLCGLQVVIDYVYCLKFYFSASNNCIGLYNKFIQFLWQKKTKNIYRDNDLSKNHSDILNCDDSEDNYLPDDVVTSTDSDLKEDAMTYAKISKGRD